MQICEPKGDFSSWQAGLVPAGVQPIPDVLSFSRWSYSGGFGTLLALPKAMLQRNTMTRTAVLVDLVQLLYCTLVRTVSTQFHVADHIFRYLPRCC